MTAGRTLERVSAGDLVQRSFGSDPAATQIGVVLVLQSDRRLDLEAVRATIAARVPAVPKLRQCLRNVPVGCGRPVWVDDPAFDIDHHVTTVACRTAGDERELLDLAATAVTTRLRADRPLWKATLVPGLAGGRTGLILVVHHVMVDGIGGLGVLGCLVDGPSVGPARPFPQPAPSRLELVVDALRSRGQALRGARSAGRRLRSAVRQLRAGMTSRAPACSLNHPTGPHRRLGVARTSLDAVRAVARAHDATVNDVVLTAVTGSLHTYLRGHGEEQDRLVVSVPVSGHTAGDRDRFGNRSGVVPVALPSAGDARSRLLATATATRPLRSGERGASAMLLEPVFRVLGAVGFLRWYIDRQRRVNTFVTNLPGPTEQLRFLGAPVTDLVAVNAITGNVTVAFGVLSYAGMLTVTVVTDPANGPDVERVTALLQDELDQLAGVSETPGFPVRLGNPPRGHARGAGPDG